MTSQDFINLTTQLTALNARLTASSRGTLAFFNQFKKFEKSFEDYVKNFKGQGSGGAPGGGGNGGGGGSGGNNNQPTPEKTLKAANAMAKSMWESSLDTINPLIKRAFATGPGLANSTNLEMIKTSAMLGVGIDQLLTEVIALREEGFNNLNDSTIRLIGRFKQTDQSTQSLIKFMSVNSLTLLQNQRQAQELTSQIASFSQVMGTRQDDMLNLAASISKSMDTRAALGTGAELTKALTNFGATLGDRGSGLVGQMTQFITNTDNVSKLFALGLQDFEDAIVAQNDPKGQVAVIGQMAKQAAATVQSIIGDLGSGPMAAKMAESMLAPYGGKDVLVFAQIAKAMEDQKQPLTDTAKALTNLNSGMEAMTTPLKIVGIGVGKLLELPVLKQLTPVLGSLIGGMLALKTAQYALTYAVRMNTQAARLSGVGGFGGKLLGYLGGPIGMIISILGSIALGIWGNKEETEELNKKTPELEKDKAMQSSMLSGYILSQISNIALNQHRGAIDREMLESTKELVRLAKKSLDVTDPQRGLPSNQARAGR